MMRAYQSYKIVQQYRRIINNFMTCMENYQKRKSQIKYLQRFRLTIELYCGNDLLERFPGKCLAILQVKPMRTETVNYDFFVSTSIIFLNCFTNVRSCCDLVSQNTSSKCDIRVRTQQ